MNSSSKQLKDQRMSLDFHNRSTSGTYPLSPERLFTSKVVSKIQTSKEFYPKQQQYSVIRKKQTKNIEYYCKEQLQEGLSNSQLVLSKSEIYQKQPQIQKVEELTDRIEVKRNPTQQPNQKNSGSKLIKNIFDTDASDQELEVAKHQISHSIIDQRAFNKTVNTSSVINRTSTSKSSIDLRKGNQNENRDIQKEANSTMSKLFKKKKVESPVESPTLQNLKTVELAPANFSSPQKADTPSYEQNDILDLKRQSLNKSKSQQSTNGAGIFKQFIQNTLYSSPYVKHSAQQSSPLENQLKTVYKNITKSGNKISLEIDKANNNVSQSNQKYQSDDFPYEMIFNQFKQEIIRQNQKEKDLLQIINEYEKIIEKQSIKLAIIKKEYSIQDLEINNFQNQNVSDDQSATQKGSDILQLKNQQKNEVEEKFRQIELSLKENIFESEELQKKEQDLKHLVDELNMEVIHLKQRKSEPSKQVENETQDENMVSKTERRGIELDDRNQKSFSFSDNSTNKSDTNIVLKENELKGNGEFVANFCKCEQDIQKQLFREDIQLEGGPQLNNHNQTNLQVITDENNNKQSRLNNEEKYYSFSNNNNFENSNNIGNQQEPEKQPVDQKAKPQKEPMINLDNSLLNQLKGEYLIQIPESDQQEVTTDEENSLKDLKKSSERKKQKYLIGSVPIFNKPQYNPQITMLDKEISVLKKNVQEARSKYTLNLREISSAINLDEIQKSRNFISRIETSPTPPVPELVNLNQFNGYLPSITAPDAEWSSLHLEKIEDLFNSGWKIKWSSQNDQVGLIEEGYSVFVYSIMGTSNAGQSMVLDALSNQNDLIVMEGRREASLSLTMSSSSSSFYSSQIGFNNSQQEFNQSGGSNSIAHNFISQENGFRFRKSFSYGFFQADTGFDSQGNFDIKSSLYLSLLLKISNIFFYIFDEKDIDKDQTLMEVIMRTASEQQNQFEQLIFIFNQCKPSPQELEVISIERGLSFQISYIHIPDISFQIDSKNQSFTSRHDSFKTLRYLGQKQNKSEATYLNFYSELNKAVSKFLQLHFVSIPRITDYSIQIIQAPLESRILLKNRKGVKFTVKN